MSLLDKINPKTGKGWTKNEIAKRADVSQSDKQLADAIRERKDALDAAGKPTRAPRPAEGRNQEAMGGANVVLGAGAPVKAIMGLTGMAKRSVYRHRAAQDSPTEEPRQKYAKARDVSKALRQEHDDEIARVISVMQKTGEKITSVSVASHTTVGRTTVSKYLKRQREAASQAGSSQAGADASISGHTAVTPPPASSTELTEAGSRGGAQSELALGASASNFEGQAQRPSGQAQENIYLRLARQLSRLQSDNPGERADAFTALVNVHVIAFNNKEGPEASAFAQLIKAYDVKAGSNNPADRASAKWAIGQLKAIRNEAARIIQAARDSALHGPGAAASPPPNVQGPAMWGAAQYSAAAPSSRVYEAPSGRPPSYRDATSADRHRADTEP